MDPCSISMLTAPCCKAVALTTLPLCSSRVPCILTDILCLVNPSPGGFDQGHRSPLRYQS